MLKTLFSPVNLLLIIAGLFGVHFCEPWLFPYHSMGLLGVIALLALVYFIVLDRNDRFQALSGSTPALLLFLVSLMGIQLLGGISQGANLSVLLFTCGLVGVSAKLEDSLFAFGVFVFHLALLHSGLVINLAPEIFVSRPPLSLQEISIPLITMGLGFFITVGAARVRGLQQLKKDYQRIKEVQASRPKNFAPSGPDKLVLPDIQGQLANRDAKKPEILDEYIMQQNERSMQSMKSVLETVVYFMSKNFKAFSAMGFLYNEISSTLHMNAYITKSERFLPDLTLKSGPGILANALSTPDGFITGDLKKYSDPLEYYSKPDGVNSVLAVPIIQTDTRKILGLLVVDSQSLRAFSDAHRELLKRFTQIAASLISNVWLTRQVSVQARWADTLYEITRSLSKQQKVEDVMGRLMDTLPDVFTHDRIIICVYNSKVKKGQVWNVLGDASGIKRGLEFEIKNERSLYGSVFTKRTEILLANYPTKANNFYRFNEQIDALTEKPQDVMIVPLFDDNQAVVAVIGLETAKAGSYSDKELKNLNTLMVNFSTALGKARAYGELEKLATIDGLTQIPNHRKFQDWLSTEMHRTQRYKEQLTLLLLDIDHFKNFNDTYGHTVGDQVLKSVAKTIQKTIRGFDLVARYGGEEFVVVMIKSDEKASRILAERICKTVEAMQVVHEGKVLKVTVSIGSSTFPKDVQTKQDLIETADAAMYYSKEHGRNQVTYYSDVAEEIKASKS